jgi:hypothetical protein
MQSRIVDVGPVTNWEAQTTIEAWLKARPEYAGWRWEGEWCAAINRAAGAGWGWYIYVFVNRLFLKVVRARNDLCQVHRRRALGKTFLLCRCLCWPDLEQRRGSSDSIKVDSGTPGVRRLDIHRRVVRVVVIA